jgi:indolepyruvate ferredoxin oxidoreductase
MHTLAPLTLDDKYTRVEGDVYITGMQALVLACLMRQRVDTANGRKTAGFVSGYRGSPVGTLDNELWAAKAHLEAHNVVFQPGVNEDLAATAVWGSQQVHLHGSSQYDGVFAMWYGKGAGLDRCGDVMRHAHGAGVTPLGGALAVSGDDHTLKSSSQAYHSEPFFEDMLMPVLYPADIQEVLDFALLGWEMSRFSGGWVGFKVLAEGVNSTSSIALDLDRYRYTLPADIAHAEDRHIRWPDPWQDVERRLYQAKLPAALAFAKHNDVNRTITKAPAPRLGIVTTGKSY